MSDEESLPKTIAWQAYDKRPPLTSKTSKWIIWTIFILLILLEIYTANYLGLVFVILAIGFILFLRSRRPKMHRFEISDAGLKIDGEDFFFTELESFWISYNPPLFKELVFHARKSLVPKIIVSLGQADPVLLHKKISQYLPEKEEEESILDLFGKLLGI